MTYLTIFATIAFVQFITCASPGANLIVISSHASAGSRKNALLSVVGILSGTITWASLALIGLGALVQTYPNVYTFVQYAGATYLVWLGLRMLWASWKNNYLSAAGAAPSVSSQSVILQGYLVNMSNPKTIAYYTSIFSALVPSGSAAWVFAVGGIVAVTVSAVWWTTLALVLSTTSARRTYEAGRRYIDMVMGGAMVLLGLRLALGRQ